MKVARILALAAAMTLAVTSMSFAAGAVWFDASPVTANASGGTAGPGQGLNLDCDVSAGLRCDWIVTVVYQTFDGGAAGWSLDLATDQVDLGKFAVKGQPNIPSSALTGVAFPPTGLNQGTVLIDNIGGTNLTPGGAPAGMYVLFTFELSKNKLPGELNTSFVYAGVGPAEFGGNDPEGFDFYEVVQIGPNAPRPGYYNGGLEALPVITIRNTPEPATLGLIGLGVLAMARRRK